MRVKSYLFFSQFLLFFFRILLSLYHAEIWVKFCFLIQESKKTRTKITKKHRSYMHFIFTNGEEGDCALRQNWIRLTNSNIFLFWTHTLAFHQLKSSIRHKREVRSSRCCAFQNLCEFFPLKKRWGWSNPASVFLRGIFAGKKLIQQISFQNKGFTKVLPIST
jgi:hypothetical protein